VTVLLERGVNALGKLAPEHLALVVRWLELLAETQNQSDIEPEELWLLATGELEQMNQEADLARPITNWRS
jgi:hypothetical protein